MTYEHILPITKTRRETADVFLRLTKNGWQFYDIWPLRDGGHQLDFYREVRA